VLCGTQALRGLYEERVHNLIKVLEYTFLKTEYGTTDQNLLLGSEQNKIWLVKTFVKMSQKEADKICRVPGVQACSPASFCLLKKLLACQWNTCFPLLVQKYLLVYLDLAALC